MHKREPWGNTAGAPLRAREAGRARTGGGTRTPAWSLLAVGTPHAQRWRPSPSPYTPLPLPRAALAPPGQRGRRLPRAGRPPLDPRRAKIPRHRLCLLSRCRSDRWAVGLFLTLPAHTPPGTQVPEIFECAWLACIPLPRTGYQCRTLNSTSKQRRPSNRQRYRKQVPLEVDIATRKPAPMRRPFLLSNSTLSHDEGRMTRRDNATQIP